MTNMTPEKLLEEIVRVADSRKAHDIQAIRVFEQTTLSDYFIIMTATSTPHVRALSEAIEKKLKVDFETTPHHVEGITSNWVLMDYSSVIVHIFLKDARELYAIETLWADAKTVDIDSYLIEEDGDK